MDYSNEQIDCIFSPVDCHQRLTAPPGAGKTEVLATRIFYLIGQGFDPKRILAATFNKSARIELSDRLLSKNVKQLPVLRTYHALGKNLCETLTKKGIIPEYQFIPDGPQQTKLARTCLSHSFNQYPSDKLNPKDPAVIESFQAYIDYCKGQITPPEAVFVKLGYSSEYECFKHAYTLFEKRRNESKQRFLPDLICDAYYALKSRPDVQRALSGQLQHILIDEYQDINPSSQALISLLVGDKTIVTAIGDDDQTINTWRGAAPEFLISIFTATYSPSITQTLTQTYRYGHELAIASYNCIVNNKNRIDKICKSVDGNHKTSIDVMYYSQDCPDVPYLDPKQTALIDAISKHIKDGGAYEDIAILLRVYSLSSAIEMALIFNGIPYQFEGARSAFSGQTFEALNSVLTLSANNKLTKQKKEKLLLTIINYPKCGFDSTNFQELSSWFFSSDDITLDDAHEKLESQKPFIKKRLINTITGLKKTLSQKSKASDIISTFVEESKLTHRIDASFTKHEMSIEHTQLVSAYINICQQNTLSCEDQLKHFNSLNKQNNNKNAVLITSVNKSKGLAWPVVIIPGLCESIFPNVATGRNTDYEAERRLFYVGITRAKKHCYLYAPDDQRLKSAIIARRDSPPAGHEYEYKNASRYIFELNIQSAKDTAQLIYTDEPLYRIPSYSSGPINSYLKAISSEHRIEAK